MSFFSVFFLGVCCMPALGFYLPGVQPTEYKVKQRVPLSVNKLDSVMTQLPYEYYDGPFCKPDELEESTQNLGQILSGDYITNTPYELFLRVGEQCKVLCRKNLNKEEAGKTAVLIKNSYTTSWIIDNLPAAIVREAPRGEVIIQRQAPIGSDIDGVGPILFNHLDFNVQYHQSPDFDGARVVGFQITPKSIKHKYETWDGKKTKLLTCGKSLDTSSYKLQSVKEGEVVYSYSVVWTPSNIKWASRWDVFFNSAALQERDQLHWMGVLNSLLLSGLTSALVAVVLCRLLCRDIATYNEESEEQEDLLEDTGWKLLHGDVFRPPGNFRLLLSALVGSGVQILCMTLLLMAFAVMGFLSPANRGGLLTALLLLFVFMGSAAGYFSARFYKLFQGKQWKVNTLATAFLYPGFVAASFFIINLFVWGKSSSGAVPITTMLALLGLWFGVSVPLVFLGSYFGFKKPEYEMPLGYNAIPRQIPPADWATSRPLLVLLSGLMPFGTAYTEFSFIMGGIWLREVYTVFGFLFIQLTILFILTIEVSIMSVYIQLNHDDYQWWWHSFLSGGSSAFYFFAYSVYYYFVNKLNFTDYVAFVLYFGNSFMLCTTLFVLTGTLGFLGTFFLLQKIYGAIKVD